MKESNRKQYRSFSWEFADYLMYRGRLRGTAKAKQSRVFTKAARRNNKSFVAQEMSFI